MLYITVEIESEKCRYKSIPKTHTYTTLHNPNVAMVSIVLQFYTILMNVYVCCGSYEYTWYIAHGVRLNLKPKVNRCFVVIGFASQLYFANIFVNLRKDNERASKQRQFFNDNKRKINVKLVQPKTQMCSVMQKHVSLEIFLRNT